MEESSMIYHSPNAVAGSIPEQATSCAGREGNGKCGAIMRAAIVRQMALAGGASVNNWSMTKPHRRARVILTRVIAGQNPAHRSYGN